MTAVADPQRAAAALAALEERLDPARPEEAGVQVLAYGEISAALLVPDPVLAGVVAKRMSGFRGAAQVERYLGLLAEYLHRLAAAGVATLPTQPHAVVRSGRAPVVYLLQPLAEPQTLGDELLRTGDDARLRAAILAVLAAVDRLKQRNRSTPRDEISIDAQLSNWTFGPQGLPSLLDVGTPFIRRDGRHAFDAEIVLSAVPPLLRTYYRYGVADSYMDDYFSARLLCIDLLGNFMKEGAAHRLPLGLAVVNNWLAHRGEDAVVEAEVADYYRKDARTLELFLKVRRADRFVRRFLHQRYDFILPGRVAR